MPSASHLRGRQSGTPGRLPPWLGRSSPRGHLRDHQHGVLGGFLVTIPCKTHFRPRVVRVNGCAKTPERAARRRSDRSRAGADGLGWPEIKWARCNGVAAPSIDLDKSTRSPPRPRTGAQEAPHHHVSDQISEIFKVSTKNAPRQPSRLRPFQAPRLALTGYKPPPR